MLPESPSAPQDQPQHQPQHQPQQPQTIDDDVVELPAIAPPDNAPGNESPTKKVKTEQGEGEGQRGGYEEGVIRRPVFKHESHCIDLEEDEE